MSAYPELTLFTIDRHAEHADDLLFGEAAGMISQIIEQDVLVDGAPELAGYIQTDLFHPFYWSAFTLVGSPW